MPVDLDPIYLVLVHYINNVDMKYSCIDNIKTNPLIGQMIYTSQPMQKSGFVVGNFNKE